MHGAHRCAQHQVRGQATAPRRAQGRRSWGTAVPRGHSWGAGGSWGRNWDGLEQIGSDGAIRARIWQKKLSDSRRATHVYHRYRTFAQLTCHLHSCVAGCREERSADRSMNPSSDNASRLVSGWGSETRDAYEVVPRPTGLDTWGGGSVRYTAGFHQGCHDTTRTQTPVTRAGSKGTHGGSHGLTRAWRSRRALPSAPSRRQSYGNASS